MRLGQIAAEEGAAAAALADGFVQGDDVSQQVEHHAYCQFADGGGAVSGGVLDADVVIRAILEVDVVKSCKCNA